MNPAIVLLSGGLDSATVAAIAKDRGHQVYALSFDYGQRHQVELQAAIRVAQSLGVHAHIVERLHLDRFRSALTQTQIAVPKKRSAHDMGRGIPPTYVPARNMIFLSFAVGHAESLGAKDIYLGINAVDYSGYPDCRPEFLESFAKTACLATKQGVEANVGYGFRFHAPLQKLTKAGIIRTGADLGVDFSLTHSCYDPVGPVMAPLACGLCDSCQIRLAGFREAGMKDPIVYDSSVNLNLLGMPG